jgi:hypothetical protein
MVKKKIVHVKIVDGDQHQIKKLAKFLKESEFAEDYKFLVTNEKIELSDIRQLIESLWSLYQKAKKFREERTK